MPSSTSIPLSSSSSFFFFLLVALIFNFLPFGTSTTFNFPNFKDSISCLPSKAGICAKGEAFVDSSNNAIQLTSTDEGYGEIYFSQPLLLWNSTTGVVSNFTTTFSFDVTFSNFFDPELPIASQIGGGISFFLVPANRDFSKDKSWGNSLGLTSGAINSVAVDFSSGDGNNNDDDVNPNCISRLGIYVNSHSTTNSTMAEPLSNSSLCLENDVFSSGPIAEAKISYDHKSTKLLATLNYNESLYQISNLVDLSSVLPEWVFVGFSARTDKDDHDMKRISSWSLQSYSEGFPQEDAGEGTTSSTKSGDFGNNAGNWEGKRRRPPVVIIFMVIIMWTLLLVVMVVLLFLILRIYRLRIRRRSEESGDQMEMRRQQRSVDSVEAAGEVSAAMDEEKLERGPRSFTFESLAVSTGNFREEQKLGRGGSASVYRGFLKDYNREVAVKRMAGGNPCRGMKTFLAEVKTISQLRHRNLVPLLGWCREGRELLLVYEYMANRSLDTHLFNRDKVLPWPQRKHIALGVASALAYLHEGWDQCVLHRDIKCSNIMLDGEFNAKVGDFGLAKLTDHGASLPTKTVAGTMGYMAPELFATGKSSKETDVYSFGVVLLEIACGRRAVVEEEEEASRGKEVLTHWLWELHGDGNVMEALDRKLSCGEESDGVEMEQFIMVGLWCSHPDSSVRPSSTQVVSALKLEAKVPPLQTPNSDSNMSPKYNLQSSTSAFSSTESVAQPMLTR